MYLKFALAVILALPGLAGAVHVRDAQPASSAGSASSAVATVGASAGASVDAVVVADAEPPAVALDTLDIVVPPVAATQPLVASDDALDAPVAEDVVVADQRVETDRVESAVVDATGHQTLGVTWPEGADVADLGGEVRTRTDGEWSEWTELAPADDSPDAGTADAANAVRGGTDPLWIGDADAVQLSFAATPDGGPDGLSLALVGSDQPVAPDAVVGTASTGTASTGSATIQSAAYMTSSATTAAVPSLLAAAVTAPRVISRAEWGAPAQICRPDVASKLVGAVVHHTAGSNAYSSVAQAMQQIRNDAAYHINGRGWCDIGYNFIVDKWGNIYEGRAGSLTQPVIGVHAGGFNTGTVGVSMLGTYDATPSAATQQAVGEIIGWRFRAYNLDPQGWMLYSTGDGDNSRFKNQTVSLPRIVGHRDTAFTACPGNGGYAALPSIRARAREFARPSLISPTISATTVAQGTPVTVRAATIGNLNWRLDVTDTRTGMVIRSDIGYAQEAFGGVVATWNGQNNAGGAVGPGPYKVELSAQDSSNGVSILPFAAGVTVTGSQNPPVVGAVALAGDLRFVPITPARVLDTRPGAQSIGPESRVDVVVAGVAGIPADAKAVALNVTTAYATTPTNIRVWPAGSARPNASVLNSDAARVASAAGAVIGVGGQGKVSLWNAAGSTHLLVDVTGYYTDAGAGVGFAPLTTAWRALDTRDPVNPIPSGQRRTVVVAGKQGVPADASAVVLNVTSAAATGNGYLSVFPSGDPVPATSTVNHLAGRNVANRTTVAVKNGAVDVYLAGASAGVLIDVVGWYGPTATARFTPVQPVRAVNTLTGSPLGAGEERAFAISSAAGLPGGVLAVSATVTATQSTAPFTFFTVWPAGAARPTTSDLNVNRAQDQANMAVVGLGSGGAVRLYNDAGTAHVLVDVTGYFK